MQEELPALKNKIASFDWKDIFNGNECALFCKLAPDATVATRRPAECKKMKDNITVLVCPNSDESEHFWRIFIGTALRGRPFKKKYETDFRLDYRANIKEHGWLKHSLMFGWNSLTVISRDKIDTFCFWSTTAAYVVWRRLCRIWQTPKYTPCTLTPSQNSRHVVLDLLLR